MLCYIHTYKIKTILFTFIIVIIISYRYDLFVGVMDIIYSKRDRFPAVFYLVTLQVTNECSQVQHERQTYRHTLEHIYHECHHHAFNNSQYVSLIYSVITSKVFRY